MTHVITSPCQSNCHQECVRVCPVDAIHGLVGSTPAAQNFIDPDICIDCSACADACPVGAPFAEDEVPAAHAADIERNREYFTA